MKRGTYPLERKNLVFNIIGVLLCFVLFVVSMVFSEKLPILIGIFGLVGFSYLIYRIVLNVKKSRANPNN